ncbi:hypothetical protein [Sansalvadorimonas verongulae]|uniref:hypothetical protein n=1 Tax=Sansalvadorimonas verongulae TaxID=2172824 RepID=UPI0012BB8536|nr:hypothetical protein [Sansalvadorimonas verongulae]MTI13007.1 hypothetical protein [Sansalvadorimonas verongulae]
MSTASNEQRIVEALVDRLTAIASTKLGYSATGLDDSLPTPSILVQLESLTETGRQGERGRFELQFNISAVLQTSEKTTVELVSLTRQIRTTLNPAEKLCPESRKHTLSDTRFDIAPSYGQLSFADSTLTVEAIL